MKVITVWFATDKGIASGCDLDKARSLMGTKEFLPYCEQFEGIPCGPFNTYHINIKAKYREQLKRYWENQNRYYFFQENDGPHYNANDMMKVDMI